MIRIAQYKGLSFTSKLIRFVTRGSYSHTAIMLSDELIIEAWQGGNKVRIIKSLSDGHKAGTSVDIFELPMTDRQEKLFRKYALKRVGAKYDYFGLLAFFINKGCWNKRDKLFCSELFYYVYRKTGKRMFAENVEPWQVSPSMITRTKAPKFLESIITHA